MHEKFYCRKTDVGAMVTVTIMAHENTQPLNVGLIIRTHILYCPTFDHENWASSKLLTSLPLASSGLTEAAAHSCRRLNSTKLLTSPLQHYWQQAARKMLSLAPCGFTRWYVERSLAQAKPRHGWVPFRQFQGNIDLHPDPRGGGRPVLLTQWGCPACRQHCSGKIMCISTVLGPAVKHLKAR